MCQGKWDGVSRQDQLAETMVPSSAEKGLHCPAIFQVYINLPAVLVCC